MSGQELFQSPVHVGKQANDRVFWGCFRCQPSHFRLHARIGPVSFHLPQRLNVMGGRATGENKEAPVEYPLFMIIVEWIDYEPIPKPEQCSSVFYSLSFQSSNLSRMTIVV